MTRLPQTRLRRRQIRFAAAALEEHLIDPEKEILSTGSISIPNPYVPEKPSVKVTTVVSF